MEDRQVNIVLFGPPGAGKGTQAENLVKEFNLIQVSTGVLLREEIEKQTTLGIKIKNIMDNGLLVSDDIINNLIKNVVSDKKYHNKSIFDGYPRNLNQAKYLETLTKKYDQKISCVLTLEVDRDIIVKRITGRQICNKCGLIFNDFFNPSTKDNHNCDKKFLQKRSDDNKKTVLSRFDTYIKTTLPVLDYYQNQHKLYKIDGRRPISEIYKEIQGIIASLET